MALTLDISSDMEILLRLQASKRGQDVTSYLIRLVEGDLHVDLSEYAGLEDFASSVAGIQAGLEDIEAGRTISLEEFVAEAEAEREQRRKRREAQKNVAQMETVA